jgi:uncharacterized OsmC-like protein
LFVSDLWPDNSSFFNGFSISFRYQGEAKVKKRELKEKKREIRKRPSQAKPSNLFFSSLAACTGILLLLLSVYSFF